MNDKRIIALLDTLRLAERLKFELRHSWTSQGRRESVAEHSYQMALMALLLHPHLEHPVDLCRSMCLVLVHDLVEAEAGDVVFFDTGEARINKLAKEQAAIEHLREMLPEPTGQMVYDLWYEFEAAESAEARFARALDNLEVQIQHNLAPFETWEEVEFGLTYWKTGKYAAHDTFLHAFAEAVVQQGDEKMRAAGVDTDPIRKQHTSIT